MEVDPPTPEAEAAEMPSPADSDDGHASITESFIAQLKGCIDTENKQATFACGGTIPILSVTGAGAVKSDDTAHPIASAPIALRWDSTSERVLPKETKLVFPLEPKTEANLQRLLQDTVPVTFGQRGEDIFDENYREASKMEPTTFSTTFNPYELGIIDTIAQVLLPSTLDSDRYRAVRAEPYKLNIHSGPSGRFKPHVDTPRSNLQFGSLVVCLPVEHEGGHLQVRHNGKEMTFDWGTSTTDEDHASIRWAAFYSDCEHEVRDVLSGHRVTLTYNLYAVRGNGLLTGHCPSLDPTHLPLCQFVDGMLKEEQFMEDGGYLGFFCTHAYPHNSKKHALFPDILKGLDMVIWETFAALRLRAKICPVVHLQDHEHYGADPDDDGLPGGYLGSDFKVYFSPRGNEASPRIMEDWSVRSRRPGGGVVGFKDITWLTKPLAMEELQIVYGYYGNDGAQASAIYSRCAIVVRVPPYDERMAEFVGDDSDEERDGEEKDSAGDWDDDAVSYGTP